MTAVFLSAAELDAAPLGSFIPMYGGGRWVRVVGGWEPRVAVMRADGGMYRWRGTVEATIDAIRPHELRRAAMVKAIVVHSIGMDIGCVCGYWDFAPTLDLALTVARQHLADNHAEVAA